MRFLVDWVPGAKNASREERETVASLQVHVDNTNVCMHLAGSKTESAVLLPLYDLANGLAHDWWTIFGSRDTSTSLIRHRAGYAIPDIRMAFDGAAFDVTAEQRTYKNPDVRFWAGPTEILTRQDAEDVLGGFIETVLAKLRHRPNETSLAMRWARVQQSREDPAEAEFCEAAGALALDPYQIDETKAQIIDEATAHFQTEALTEFLVGAKEVDASKLLEWVTSARKRPSYKGKLPELEGIARNVAEASPTRGYEQSYALGYRRARALRQACSIKQAHRFPSYKALASLFGASPHFVPTSNADGIRLLRENRDDGVHLHLRLLGKNSKASYAYTLARGIGDVICFPDTAVAPVNDLHAAYRQASGRAFAAEFLAPIDEIDSMLADGRDHAAIADELHVSSQTIDRQVENRLRIRQACE